MIIIHDGLVYEVTRKSAAAELHQVLAKEFENIGKYSKELRASMLDEILENTNFPEILDEPRIFVYDESSKCFTGYKLTEKPVKDKNAFSIKDFSPKCIGTTLVKEAKAVFQKYSLNNLIGSSENGVPYPVVYFYNNECLVGGMDKNPVQVLTKAFKDIVGIENAEKIANTVSDKVFADTSLFVTFVKEDSETNCYALRSDGSIKKTTPFSVASIKKSIMAELPKMKCTTEKATTAAIYAHNQILYGIGIANYELTSPTGFTEDGEPIFERMIDGFNFWIKPGKRNWRSKKTISVPICLISWESSDFDDDLDTTCRHVKYKHATYNGFSVAGLTYEEAMAHILEKGIKTNILRRDSRIGLREESWEEYYYKSTHREEIPMFSINSYNGKLEKATFESFEFINKITDLLHFKLETAAEILE